MAIGKVYNQYFILISERMVCVEWQKEYRKKSHVKWSSQREP